MTLPSRSRIAVLLGIAALAAGAIVVSSPWREAPAPPRGEISSPAPSAPTRVLVQLMRGRLLASEQEVSITTIFGDSAFAVVADADVAGASETEMERHVRDIFSLKEVVFLGSSIVPLKGGSALLDDNGQAIEFRIEGQPVGAQAVRLQVSQVNDGEEIVATSVIARRGKTIVLAGPPLPVGDGERADQQISFVCLTPLS